MGIPGDGLLPQRHKIFSLFVGCFVCVSFFAFLLPVPLILGFCFRSLLVWALYRLYYAPYAHDLIIFTVSVE